ncbi:hypothetical protein [Leptospira borgpetersenii]|uniref:hypothetical protein n=1 Tax=Leptospira borgpetersenii TaxID=174 RepID=UPI0018812D51|nr:hypothetical protein [Leptospira borgpetersenii]MBE8364878.1 hypothetical protein [Leptospira borgpetersenii serovar Balcanica]MBE8367831.1 hypothetical protein [Leptospira borgpetersenii serovar Balcanica]MBE8423986.1 hypothetical protein [Leptospira borgpetersenii serovar Balcanica]MBF3350597.1 hypothetical protein [Leptospira borgpetersenii serovar Balcanica]
MEANQRKEGYAIGEAVRNKTTGQRMYVDASWDGKVPCVYFDAEKGNLVKIRMYPEELERIQGVLPYLPK